MSAFIKIKLTFLDEFNFGQDSTAKAKSFLQIPYEFIENDRIKMLDSYLLSALLLLIKASLTNGSDTFFCCKNDMRLPQRISLGAALQAFAKLELVEIIDDTLLVKKRKKENILESLPYNSETETRTPLGKISTSTLEQITTAWTTYAESLTVLGIPPARISPPEEYKLAKHIPAIGFENVIDALWGARLETATRDFNPVKFMSVDYILSENPKTRKSNWSRMANAARLHKAQQSKNLNLENIARGSL